MVILFIFLLFFYNIHIINYFYMIVGTVFTLLNSYSLCLSKISKLSDFKYPNPIRYLAQFFLLYLIQNRGLFTIGVLFLLYGMIGEILSFIY